MRNFFLGVLAFWREVFLLILIVFPLTAYTQSASWAVPEINSLSAVIMDAETGTIVYSKNPDMEIPPASMTKLMTMHIAFKEIYAGNASLNEIIEPGQESWARNQLPGSSLMYLAPGQRLTLRELFLGLAIFSGNDAAAAVALRFAPTVDAFIDMMNMEARAMGLTRTSFADASGYSENNMTTAREFAEFTRQYLEANPQSLGEFHSVSEFAYPLAVHVGEAYRDNPGTRVQRNRNTLLGRVEGVDGLKTGSIPAAGFNIALTAERNGTRFIAVTMGAETDRERDEDGEALLNWAFNTYKTIRLYPDDIEPERIWMGKENYVNLAYNGTMVFTSLAMRGENMTGDIVLTTPFIAPLPAGTHVGNLIVYDNLGELRTIPIITVSDIERGGFWKRLFDRIRLFFAGY